MHIHGLLLAAGAGSRYGRPKVLVDDWTTRAIMSLSSGGCERVTVVLGAEAERAATTVPAWVDVCIATDWAEGMGASLRAGLQAVERSSADAALVHLVDVPDIGAEIVSRIAQVATGPHSLARAVFRGAPGHPVLLGSDHWKAIRQSLVGDRGARDYLAANGAVLVECGDLATGRDLDEPPEVDQDA